MVAIILVIGAAIAGAQTIATLDPVTFRIPTVTLRFAGEGVVDGHSLTLARRGLAEILGHAGLDVLWLTCMPGIADWRSANPCQRDRQLAEFWVRIVIHKPAAVRPEVLAFAEIDDELGMRSAGVYYSAIVETASRHGIPAGLLLGAALAHEVGHLVLGTKAYSHQGLMSPDWRREQSERLSLDSLALSKEDARKLRENVAMSARSYGLCRGGRTAQKPLDDAALARNEAPSASIGRQPLSAAGCTLWSAVNRLARCGLGFAKSGRITKVAAFRSSCITVEAWTQVHASTDLLTMQIFTPT